MFVYLSLSLSLCALFFNSITLQVKVSHSEFPTLTMFQSGSKYYLWNPIEGGIWEIVMSVDLVDIITQIDKLGLISLKVAKVPTEGA
jgi:hypothetical protein